MEKYNCSIITLKCFLSSHDILYDIDISKEIENYLIDENGMTNEDFLKILIQLMDGYNMSIFHFTKSIEAYSGLLFILKHSTMPAILCYKNHIICITGIKNNNIYYIDQYGKHIRNVYDFLDLNFIVYIENTNITDIIYNELEKNNCGTLVYKNGQEY